MNATLNIISKIYCIDYLKYNIRFKKISLDCIEIDVESIFKNDMKKNVRSKKLIKKKVLIIFNLLLLTTNYNYHINSDFLKKGF